MKLIHVVEVINDSPNIYSFRANKAGKAEAAKLFVILATENDVKEKIDLNTPLKDWNVSDEQGYDLLISDSYLKLR